LDVTRLTDDTDEPDEQPLQADDQADLIVGPSPSFHRLARLIEQSSITAEPGDVIFYDAASGEFDLPGQDVVFGQDGPADWLVVDDAAALGADRLTGVGNIAWGASVA
jgi:hypothetical protein